MKRRNDAGGAASRDIAFSRKFYAEFLGLEVVQTRPKGHLDRNFKRPGVDM